MKNWKFKIAAFLTAIVTMFSFPICAFASTTRFEWSVTMKIVAYTKDDQSSSMGGWGHAFLAFYNDGTVDITIGHMTVEPNSSVTISTFDDRSAHKGIWYNIEGHNIAGIDWVTAAAMTISLTEAELETVNDAINSHDRWELLDNCCGFSGDVWNSVAPSKYTVSGLVPSALYTSIKSFPDYETTVSYDLYYQPLSKIAYHTDKSFVYSPSGATAG